jgi:hypothetical protein
MGEDDKALLIAPEVAAMMKAAMRATIAFAGRDRRRIKREMRKAFRAANPYLSAPVTGKLAPSRPRLSVVKLK